MNNVNRIVRNEDQPLTKPRFTKLGFKKARLPEEAYKLLLDHWNQGKDKAVVEPWSKSDCHTNFYEVDIGSRPLLDLLVSMVCICFSNGGGGVVWIKRYP